MMRVCQTRRRHHCRRFGFVFCHGTHLRALVLYLALYRSHKLQLSDLTFLHVNLHSFITCGGVKPSLTIALSASFSLCLSLCLSLCNLTVHSHCAISLSLSGISLSPIFSPSASHSQRLSLSHSRSIAMWCGVWFRASALQPHTHTHYLLVVMLKSMQLKTKISHTHSLILSHSLTQNSLSQLPTLP